MLQSRPFRTGLALLGVLSVLDVLGPLLTDGTHPPVSVALAGSVIGLASLALVVSARRGAERSVPVLAALRTLSALSAAPAFVVSGVPGAAIVAAAAVVVLNVVGVALVLKARRATVLAGVR